MILLSECSRAIPCEQPPLPQSNLPPKEKTLSDTVWDKVAAYNNFQHSQSILAKKDSLLGTVEQTALLCSRLFSRQGWSGNRYRYVAVLPKTSVYVLCLLKPLYGCSRLLWKCYIYCITTMKYSNICLPIMMISPMLQLFHSTACHLDSVWYITLNAIMC